LFQYPEGHSSGFHVEGVTPDTIVRNIGLGPLVSVPRRAFLWFPHDHLVALVDALPLLRFQCPEGHSFSFHSMHTNCVLDVTAVPP